MAGTKGLHLRDTLRLERNVDDLLKDYLRSVHLVLMRCGFECGLRNKVVSYVGLFLF